MCVFLNDQYNSSHHHCICNKSFEFKYELSVIYCWDFADRS